MPLPRTSSLLVAGLLTAGLSVVVTPPAFAGGVADCVSAAKADGLKDRDAGQACSYAHGGDAADCAWLVKADSRPAVNDENAADTCGKAAPPPAPAAS